MTTSPTGASEHSEAKSAPTTPAAIGPHAGAAKKGGARVVGGALGLVALIAVGIWYVRSLGTVSTDDAYVNGHVTFVAARVGGQVARVLVDDNNRVRKGDVLVQLDPEPRQRQVDIAQAAVAAAQSDLAVAQAQTRGAAALARSHRFNLEHTIEDVNNRAALLRSKVAALKSEEAVLENAQRQFDRVTKLHENNAAGEREVDDYRAAYLVATAKVEGAHQDIEQVRVGLGLPPKPANGGDLTQVPEDLDQTQSAVRQAQASLIQAVAALGVSNSFSMTPRQMIAEFYKRDPQGDIDRIYAELMANAPNVKQGEARLAQAQRQLDEANLHLRYCNVVAEIDGVVTRRNVNPGNNIVPGQALMAVRSLTEIWVDANFKETQLARLRIGQPVDLDVDMYGSKQRFAGRVTGFTMGTGSTLALLPPQNATGNFVKVVQRLPVRIELTNYNPDAAPLFIGLSVTPVVHVDGTPEGPNAGKVLQPYQALQTGSATAGSSVPGTTETTGK